MTRDLSTPLAPTFAETAMGGPGKRKKKKKKLSRACKKHKRGCKEFRKNVSKHGYGGF